MLGGLLMGSGMGRGFGSLGRARGARRGRGRGMKEGGNLGGLKVLGGLLPRSRSIGGRLSRGINMGRGSRFLAMETVMRDLILMESLKVKGLTNGPMEQSIQVNFTTVSDMVKVDGNSTNKFMKGITLMIRDLDMGNIFGGRGVGMRDSLRRILGMGLGKWFGPMEEGIRGNGEKGFNGELERFGGRMEGLVKGFLRVEKWFRRLMKMREG